MTASVLRNSIRTGVFVTAVMVALVVADDQAHADDPTQAATPAPDPGPSGPPTPDGVVTPPPDTAPPPDTTPTSPPPAPSPPAPPPAVPGGSVDVPTAHMPSIPLSPGDETAPTPDDDIPWPVGTGTNTAQNADVTNDGTAVANTGDNSATATAPGGIGVLPGGSVSGIQTGTANGQGSLDHSGISQEINASVTDNGHVVVVQVAVIVNIGIGLAGSGGNIAGAESATPPKLVSSVAMIVGNEAAGAGAGPTGAAIHTGSANATGNTGTTQVTQSIVLTGNDVAAQLAAVLNIGVGVSNSGLNFALAAVSGNTSGTPSSVTFVTTGGGSSIATGAAGALGNRSTSTVFQVVTVSASGNGSLLVIQRAIIVNFGLALANSGLNVAGGGALNATMPDPAAAQQLLLMLLDSGSAAPGAASAGGSNSASGGGAIAIGTGAAHAIGNDTTTGIRQEVAGSVSGDDTARAMQDAWVGNFGLGVANSGGNGAMAGLSGMDPTSLAAARGALQAFLSGLTGIGDPLQGLDANFQLGSNLLQLHGDVSGTESLLGIAEPGTDVTADSAAVVVRQVTAVLNIGIAMGESGHNVAVAETHETDGTTVAGPGTTVATATITTGNALAIGNHFATTVCQTIGDSIACAAPTPPPEEPEEPEPEIPVVVPEGETNPPPSNPFTPPAPVFTPAAIPATLPFTGSPIGAELAAGSGILIAGMLMARRRRAGARP